MKPRPWLNESNITVPGAMPCTCRVEALRDWLATQELGDARAEMRLNCCWRRPEEDTA